MRFWIGVLDNGSSSPFVSTRLSDCALNWQNAPKRSIAWKPSTVAALKINNLSDGGRGNNWVVDNLVVQMLLAGLEGRGVRVEHHA